MSRAALADAAAVSDLTGASWGAVRGGGGWGRGGGGGGGGGGGMERWCGPAAVRWYQQGARWRVGWRPRARGCGDWHLSGPAPERRQRLRHAGRAGGWAVRQRGRERCGA